MISLLQNLVDNLLCWIKTGLIDVLNLLTAALSTGANAVLSVFPDAPTMPDLGGVALPGGEHLSTVIGWLNYLFPMGTLVAALLSYATFLMLFWVGEIALRWAKVVE